ncbi:MAG: aminotransferase class III-fold pyridoxal phosphate-dependent enzyme, partial [Rhodocyclaceae bacterium]|nr:aminotransferase class III-fold pyridoxal phosphate-dependent enzyme [Rhodocyclaceae bacterium]
LADMSENSLKVLETRSDIACVLINPLQALHPNKPAPGDSSLVDSSRAAGFDRDAYTAWLRALREVCTRRGIVLIMDEVFVGFRLAPGGAQEYFGIRADMVTYGKTLGGGLPVGVVCGKKDLMQRFRAERPADICFARGTFNSHPYVMGAMQVFLERINEFDMRLMYNDLDAIWNARAADLNERLLAEGLPVHIDNLSTIWTVSYTVPSRYNWMFQYYLKAEGLLLSWVGTGRFIFSLNYTDADFSAVTAKFIQAARRMSRDGWWWADTEMTNKSIKRMILSEMLRARRV